MQLKCSVTIVNYKSIGLRKFHIGTKEMLLQVI